MSKGRLSRSKWVDSVLCSNVEEQRNIVLRGASLVVVGGRVRVVRVRAVRAVRAGAVRAVVGRQRAAPRARAAARACHTAHHRRARAARAARAVHRLAPLRHCGSWKYPY